MTYQLNESDLTLLRETGVSEPDIAHCVKVAEKALEMLDIDKQGLDEMDKRILETILHKFAGGPVGLNSLAVSVGEEPDTIEEVYEPFLIQEGFLKRTPQGRVATDLCYKRFGVTPAASQGRLL